MRRNERGHADAGFFISVCVIVAWLSLLTMKLAGAAGGLSDEMRGHIQEIACERAVCPTPEGR